MSIEQRANIKFCFKLGKTFTETHQMMKQVYGDDCLSRSRIHEWFKRFQVGREDLEDNERLGRPKEAVNEINTEIVREFIKKEPKSSLKYMESALSISSASIYRILTENLDLRKEWEAKAARAKQDYEEAVQEDEANGGAANGGGSAKKRAKSGKEEQKGSLRRRRR